MFATSDRVSPCRARSSPRSVGRVTVSSPSPCSIFMRCGTCCVSSPSGPLTITRPGSIDTDTPAGNSMGVFPIRLMALPDETDDFAADAFALGGLARDETPRRRHDRRPHPSEDARQPVLSSVDAAARLRDALEVGDDALPARPVLELDDERVEALARLALPADDVALLLKQARDLLLLARGRHLRGLVQRLVRVADAGEHVCDRVGQHLDHQLDLVMPGIWPWCARSRRQIRQRPNLR